MTSVNEGSERETTSSNLLVEKGPGSQGGELNALEQNSQ